MSDRPYPGESLADFRARRTRELADEAKGVGSGPTADQQVEAAKAKVRQQNAEKAAGPAHKRAVNMNTAEKDADELERSGDMRRHGGVKALDMDAIKAADKEINKKTGFGALSAEEQAKVAKSTKSSDTPAGAVHSTSTPGAAHQTAMAAAMQAAGVPAAKSESAKPLPPKSTDKKTGQPTYQSKDKALTVTPAVAGRNNMANHAYTNDTSIVSGATSKDSPAALAQARAAATKGSRTSNKAAEDAAARRSASPRNAASKAPAVVPPSPPMAFGGQFGNSRMAEGFAHMVNPAPGPSSKLSDKPAAAPAAKSAPVSNPAPKAPAPAQNATPAAPSAPTTQPAKAPAEPFVSNKGNTIGRSPAAGVTPGHMVSSAPGRDWLSPQAANKAKAKATPREAVAEMPALAPSPAPKKKESVGGRSAPSSAGAVGNVNRSAMPAAHDYSSAVRGVEGARHNIGGPMAQVTPMAAPQMERAHAAESSGLNAPGPLKSRTRTPVTTPSGPVGGGRSGTPHQGGERNINVGGDNYGHVTQNHNTYNINYGHVGGSQGNVDHGYSPRGGYARGGGAGGGEHERPEGHDGKFNIRVKDVNGTHDLRKGLDHITGRTGGSGERLDKGENKPTIGGGAQRPIKGSSRSAGSGGTPTQPQSTTGTTHDWTGPQHQSPTSASGNGTAQQKTVP